MKGRVLPNFFIIGAAKAGTTSMHEYLGQHPDVFMSPVKEPNFFAFLGEPPSFAGPVVDRQSWVRDRLKRERYGYSITDWADYERLFKGARHHKAVGESSVSYMYYPRAAQRIREFVPEARFLVILRHPVDRAYSKYMQFRRDASEPLPDFSAAVAAEEERRSRNWSPTWFYLDRGYYHRQLLPYVELFGRDRFLVLLYEDYARDTAGAVKDALRFLGVDPEVPIDVAEKHNVSRHTGVPRSVRVYDLLVRPNVLSRSAQLLIPQRARRWVRPLVKRIVFRPGSGKQRSERLDPALRSELTKLFEEDILRLQDLIGRDLSHWLEK